MVFCNKNKVQEDYLSFDVTILILVDGFLQFLMNMEALLMKTVTILILVDGFLQSDYFGVPLNRQTVSQSLF